MSTILLCTLNARYAHSALGLRYLRANLDPALDAAILEFTINQRPVDIVEAILAQQPRIVGLGVYIWNVRETTEVVAQLKAVRPDLTVVLGGPEISYEADQQAISTLADYVISGPGELSFNTLCGQLLGDEAPTEKYLPGETPNLTELQLPYAGYSDHDIAHRVLYVEASRGCPFRCEFCLSALDRSVIPFPLERFLDAMDTLYQRGARQFKFVDRTFNLKAATGVRILEFFLERLDPKLFLHFELIPDHLPDALRTVISRFPPGSLQFEVGIQSFNPTVQQLISRRQDQERSEANLRWLHSHSHAHLHTDLIVGLPGEDLESFGAGFNRLVALGPHEIQVGLLKRLRGTPIIRHTRAFDLRFSPVAPYTLLQNRDLDFSTLQRLGRFARYWDMVGNSGRFRQTLPLLLADAPFQRFLAFSDALFGRTGQTHKIQLQRLFTLVYEGICGLGGVDGEQLRRALQQDFEASGLKGRLQLDDQGSGNTGKQAPDAPPRQRRFISP